MTLVVCMYVRVYGSLYRLNKEASTTLTLGVCASLDMAQLAVIFQEKEN